MKPSEQGRVAGGELQEGGQEQIMRGTADQCKNFGFSFFPLRVKQGVTEGF